MGIGSLKHASVPGLGGGESTIRVRTKKEELETCEGLSHERRCQSLVLTVIRVPHSLDSGSGLRGSIRLCPCF